MEPNNRSSKLWSPSSSSDYLQEGDPELKGESGRIL